MEPVRLWAAVQFTAQNGSPETLLTEAARQGLHLYGISPLPGGFCAHCAARHYHRLARLAQRQHVRLRMKKKQGLYFVLRPLLRRKGLWAGLVSFAFVLLWLQQLVWAVDYGTLTTGQQARSAVVLRNCGLQPGAIVTEAKLTAGEYALLESGEFSWASLNFEKGRLSVEAAPAKSRPDIAAGTLHGLRATYSGTVLRTNLVSGTMLVAPGQTVEAGQGLIGTARSERDGTLIFVPAAGTVIAQIVWSTTQDIPLVQETPRLTGEQAAAYTLFWAGKQTSLPAPSASEQTIAQIRYLQPDLLGLPLPCMLEEITFYAQSVQTIQRTEEEALALARLYSVQALFAAFPEAELIARAEEYTTQETVLHYTVTYTVAADICG